MCDSPLSDSCSWPHPPRDYPSILVTSIKMDLNQKQCGEAEKWTHTIQVVQETQEDFPRWTFGFFSQSSSTLPASLNSFSSSSIHCLYLAFLSPAACFPTHQKEKQPKCCYEIKSDRFTEKWFQRNTEERTLDS